MRQAHTPSPTIPPLRLGRRGPFQAGGRRAGTLAIAAAFAFVALLGASAILPALPDRSTPAAALRAPHRAAPILASITPVRPGPGAVVQLGISSNPAEICEGDIGRCPAATGESTVTLSAQAGVKGHNAWPAVQMLFLLETTPYDGVYDPSAAVPGSDPCGDAEIGTSPLCFESNGVPFFVRNAGTIATTLQAAYPNTTLSFGLLDFFATHDAWDSGGGTTYHIDIGSFVNSTLFGRTVAETFQRTLLGGGFIIPNSDLRQNFLSSDSISVLYGALSGWGGIRWSNATHHVIVQVGMTAPRDPNYPENYCVSPAVTPRGLQNCTAATVEPPTTIQKNVTPAGEGWILPNGGNASGSIAALAHDAPICVGSLGTNCTIDEIDFNGTPTNPRSPSWSAAGGSGGPANWTADATSILEAGCDMASSTGGSWDGPSWFTCRSLGAKGTLGYVPIVDSAQPQTSNPGLVGAFAHLGLGEVPTPVVAAGADRPMFEFLPWAGFGPAPLPSFKVVCKNATGASKGCPSVPTFVTVPGGVTAFTWNWSNDAATNRMLLGDTWNASFVVDAVAPPFGLLPVDSCTTPGCLRAGSGPIGLSYTSMAFREYGGQNLILESFPLSQIAVDPLIDFGVPALPGIPILPGPLAPNVPPPSTPLVPPTPAPPIPAGAISVYATAAGFIAAGLIRIGLRQPPMATRQASFSGAFGRKRRPRTGRFRPRMSEFE